MNKENNNVRYKVLHMSCRICVLLTLCLMILPLDLLTFMNGPVYANSEGLVEYELNPDDQNSSTLTSDDVQKMLWQTNITPAKEEKEQVQKDELQALIEQLNSMEMSPSFPVVEPEYNNDTAIIKEQKRNESQTEKHVEKKTTANENKYEVITENTIQKLQILSNKPEAIDNPYEIGDTLYQGNCIGQAAPFYKEALRRTKPDSSFSSEDRAWLMFQTANSLQTIDMLEASEIYRKLITEYPDSPWADYARIQSKLITWYSNDKPEDLLKEYKR